MKYYVLHDFSSPAVAWGLRDPHLLGDTESCPPLGVGRRCSEEIQLEVELSREGQSVDYSYAGTTAPVLSCRALKAVESWLSESVQVLNVSVGSHRERFFLLNLLHRISALDESRSKFEKYPPGHKVYDLDLSGRYRWVHDPIIDPSKVPEGVHIFRLFGFGVMIFVSEPLHDAMVAAKLTGAGFDPAF